MRVFELFEAGLTYRGYPCTKDCSGHQAGYNWAVAFGLSADNCPYSNNSFWEGCISKDEPGPDQTEESIEESLITEKYVHNVDFDMATFARNMAALRASKYMPDNYPDAIMFLGFVGDPATNFSVTSRPAKIANYDITGVVAANLPKNKRGPWSSFGTNGQFPGGSYQHEPKIDPEIAANPNEVEFDIWINSEYADMRNPRALHLNQSRAIAHELRHRGFQIIDYIPALRSKMPEIYQSVGNHGYVTDPRHEPYITKKINSQSMGPSGREGILRPQHDFYLTHAMMYALEYPAIHGHYDNDKQRLAYKQLYMDCERVVRQYLDGKSVPPQGWAILRNEVDKRTPDNVQITIKPGPDHAVVTGTTKPAETPSSTSTSTPTSPRVFIDKWTGNSSTSPPKSTNTSPTLNQPKNTTPVTPAPGDGPTGIELAKFGVSRSHRLNQQFVDSVLGPNRFKAGSAESNLALLAHFKKQTSKATTPVQKISRVQDEPKPAQESIVREKWSQKYKNSINCSNPKGFSQRAHCQGRKKS